MESGDPQDTVLGPLLFLRHINDLPDSVSTTVRLFVHDCLLYRTIKCMDDHLKLQQDLASLEKWAENWGMRFNAKKCYVMSINSKSSHFYSLDNQILGQVQGSAYLGLTLSEDLKWGPHIQKITKPEDHWSCIAHLSAEDMLKSAVIEEKKFQNIEPD